MLRGCYEKNGPVTELMLNDIRRSLSHVAAGESVRAKIYSQPGPVVGKRDVIHKTGSTQHIATPSEEDRATLTDNMLRKLRKVWTCGFRDMLADRQTDMPITILQ